MVLFNLIFRLLSNVILMIRNGCLPKFRHLQSTANKPLKNTAAHLETVVKIKKPRVREGGFVSKCTHILPALETNFKAAAPKMTRHLNATQ